MDKPARKWNKDGLRNITYGREIRLRKKFGKDAIFILFYSILFFNGGMRGARGTIFEVSSYDLTRATIPPYVLGEGGREDDTDSSCGLRHDRLIQPPPPSLTVLWR